MKGKNVGKGNVKNGRENGGENVEKKREGNMWNREIEKVNERRIEWTNIEWITSSKYERKNETQDHLYHTRKHFSRKLN